MDEVAKLVHQLRKMRVLDERTQGPPPSPEAGTLGDRKTPEAIRRIQEVLGLYLDMHDAQFKGGELERLFDDNLPKLFKCREDYHYVFPPQQQNNLPKGDRNDRIPVRGLREMIRFGGGQALNSILNNSDNAMFQITPDHVQKFKYLESEIETAQKERAKLHDDWKKTGKNFLEIKRIKKIQIMLTYHHST